jgi:hypothetical protein
MNTQTRKQNIPDHFTDIQSALTHYDQTTASSSKHFVIAQGMNGHYYVMLKEEAEGLKTILVDRPTFTDIVAAEEERLYLEKTHSKRFAIRYTNTGTMYVSCI